MAVAKPEYLNFTFFAVAAFGVGFFILKDKLKFDVCAIDNQKASILGRTLIFIGSISYAALTIVPESFSSILNFFALFVYIGLYALLFSKHLLDKILMLFFIALISIYAVIQGKLIDLVIFVIFFSMFLSLKYKISKWYKILAIVIGFSLLNIYQGIKIQYRTLAWDKDASVSQKINFLGELINKKTLTNAFNTDLERNYSLIYTMRRLNQGWQTSKVYNNVPENIDFENGKDILKDIISSFIPRVIWKNKKVVNAKDRFMYYTNYEINDETTMTIGVIGDFYINFGKLGTIIGLFLFGLILAVIKRFYIVKFVNPNPINLIWIPFVFTYLIRPGNDFYMVFNHIIKSIIILSFVFFILYPILEKIFKIEFQKNVIKK